MAASVVRGTPAFRVLLPAVLVLALALRLHGIDQRPIWFDEGVSIGVAKVPFEVFVGGAWKPSLSNQVFYYLALRPWLALGDGELAVRGLSALASLGSVALLGLLGRRLHGAPPGLAIALLAALHWPLVRYAQEARGYALATFLACAAALHLARYVDEGRRRDLALWVGAAALAMYAHFFALFAVAAQVVSLAALGPGELRRRQGTVVGAALLLVAATPILSTLATSNPDLIRWIAPVTVSRIAGQARFLAGGPPWAPWLYAGVFVLLAAAVLREHDARRRWASALPLCWAVLPLATMSAVSLWTPILLGRYLLASAPGWLLSVAALSSAVPGAAAGRGAPLALASVLALAEAATVGEAWRQPFEDWKTPAGVVAKEARPGDAILYESKWCGLAFGYYLDRGANRPVALQEGDFLYRTVLDPARIGQHDRVWLVLSRQDRATAASLRREIGRTHGRGRMRYAGVPEVHLYERR